MSTHGWETLRTHGEVASVVYTADEQQRVNARRDGRGWMYLDVQLQPEQCMSIIISPAGETWTGHGASIQAAYEDAQGKVPAGA